MSLTNEQIVDAVAAKSLMEVMELVKAIEEKFGVTAAAPVMVAGPAAAEALAANGAETGRMQSLDRYRGSRPPAHYEVRQTVGRIP